METYNPAYRSSVRILFWKFGKAKIKSVSWVYM